MNKQIVPPATIGILGGGQLGRMLALAGREMGYEIVTLDPTPNSPCGQLAKQQIQADFTSVTAAQELARCSSVLTYEFENIGAEVAKQLEMESYLPQGYALLYTTQNRLREKKAIEQAGIPVAPYRAVTDASALKVAATVLGLPFVLKTTEGGYDGKGQLVISDTQQLKEALDVVAQSTRLWVAEAWIPFAKELSIIVARNPAGQIETFPVAENIHRNNILHLSIAPARINQDVAARADELARTLAKQFQLVGLLAIELFLTDNGQLIVNELAPRPHNSGHYTQQACITSQFEQHIRAICNLPLAKPSLVQPTVMVNILGEHLASVLERWPHWPGHFKLHLYGKSKATIGRKMGHINVVTSDVEQALKEIRETSIWEMEGIG